MKRINELSSKQEKLITCLLTEHSIEGACKKANVGGATYWRWMRSRAFFDAYHDARRAIFENSVARLQSITASAIDTLERNLICGNPSVETRTATVILEQSVKGIESLDLANRIEMMEALLNSIEEER